jgi:hypothetical protein
MLRNHFKSREVIRVIDKGLLYSTVERNSAVGGGIKEGFVRKCCVGQDWKAGVHSWDDEGKGSTAARPHEKVLGRQMVYMIWSEGI